MKRILALFLACLMVLTACSSSDNSTVPKATDIIQDTVSADRESDDQSNQDLQEGKNAETKDNVSSLSFKGLDDEALIGYVEDNVYSSLANELKSEDYIIENIEAVYYPKEYIEALASNSQSNRYFGYTSDELNELFQGTKYVFTLGEDGQTTVVPMEIINNDIYVKAMEDVLIGAGVILLCVTVSVVTAPMAPVVSMVFAASASTATSFAAQSGAIGFAAAAIAKGYETESFSQALKAGAEAAGEGFKWGAVIGAVAGGAGEAIRLRGTSKLESPGEIQSGLIPDIKSGNLRDWRKAELRALKKYKGREQVSFLDGVEVPAGTPGATRPDVIRTVRNHIEAIEVKYYNLENPSSLSTLYSELEREVSARVANLPANATQRVVLDVTGKGIPKATVKAVKKKIQSRLMDIYGSKIPVDIVGV